jgi:ABC-2 type transport system permease protein
MKAMRIAAGNVRRTLRERTNLFFVLVFPLLLILLLGVAFGGTFSPRLGVVGQPSGPLSQRLFDQLEEAEGIDVVRVDDPDTLTTSVERGRLEAGLVVPDVYDDDVSAGDVVRLPYLSRSGVEGMQIRSIVDSAVEAASNRARTAQWLENRFGTDFDTGLALTDQSVARLPAVTVETSTAGEAMFPANLGRFDVGASGQLLLFIFVTSMTASTALIESRRLGLTRRMLATPTRPRTIIAGEALGRYAVAVLQGVIIMVGSALLFGVTWGEPLAATAIMLTFALVASGAGMLLGSMASTEQQAIGIGLLLGLGMAALGGSMMPLDFFSQTLRLIADITPHAWANAAFAELIRHDADIVAVLPNLAVLGAAAATLFALAAWRLRKSIVAG